MISFSFLISLSWRRFHFQNIISNSNNVVCKVFDRNSYWNHVWYCCWLFFFLFSFHRFLCVTILYCLYILYFPLFFLFFFTIISTFSGYYQDNLNISIIIDSMVFLSWFYFEDYFYVSEIIYFIDHLVPNIMLDFSPY